MSTTIPDPKIADDVLAGIVNRAELARAMRCSERTIIRLDPPAIRLGGRIFYRIEAVRAWMLEQERSKRSDTVRRGRPTSRAA